jgi:uncharacterized OB-fold protein
MTSTEPPGAVGAAAEGWVEEEDGRIFLIGARCQQCGKHSFPYRSRCDQCGTRDSTARARLSRSGLLYSFSTIHVAPKGFATPYVIGYVDLPEEVRLFGQIEGNDAGLHMGATVELILGVVRVAEGGERVMGYKFRLRRAEHGA